MSTTVDQRVVEMRFDNAQFERGAKESLSTLDKLKEKLQFKGAEKGFENISAASRKVDFDEMSGALDTIQMKFSAMDVIAVTALTHITEKLISTGEQMVKSLSVDQITSGWSKYVEKTGNVQTIMNATGKSVDQVNGYLAKLMWYSDETSFSFNEMTSALSSATAAGGKIDKMIPMIMGIANATADAGKNGYAFQSTIRNLMQSYSAGYLQLMDWKSLNLMGTGTKALKQELISTAEELGTIQKGEVTISNFETTLSKKWATREVMEKTFGKYAQMMTDAYELTQQNKGMTTSEALEQLSGKYGEIAERSALAAQQAKSFGEAIDSTKDAVSSKWMAIFETIVGGYDEAVKTWTELANRLYDIFAAPLDDLEDRLNDGLNSGWDRFLDNELEGEGQTFVKILEEVAVKSGAISEEALEKAGGIKQALRNGAANAELLAGGLKKAQTDAHAVLDMSDEQIASYGKTRKEVQAIADAFDKVNAKVEDGTLDLKQYAKEIRSMSGREHLLQGLWNIWDAIAKIITPIKEAWSEIFPPKAGEQIFSIAEGFDNLTKKLIISDDTAEKIRKTFTGVFSVLKALLIPVEQLVKWGGKAVDLLTDAAKPVAKILLNITAGLGEFGTAVAEAVTGSGTLRDKLESIKMAAKQLLSPLTGLSDAMKGTKLGKSFTEWLSQMETGEGLLSVLVAKAKATLGKISPLLSTVVDKALTVGNAAGSAIAGIAAGLVELGKWTGDFLKKQLPSLNEMADNVAKLPEKVNKGLKEFLSGFRKEIETISGSSREAFEPITGFFTALKAGLDSVRGTDVYRLLSLIDVGVMSYAIVQVAKAMKSFKEMLKDPLTNLLDSMAGSFKSLSGALKAWTKAQNNNILTTMATSVLILAGALFVIGQVDMPHLAVGIGAIAGAFIALLLTAKKIAGLMDVLDTKKLASLAGVMGSFAAAMLGLAIGIKWISGSLIELTAALSTGHVDKKLEAFTTGILGISTLMIAMGTALSLLTVKGGKVIGAKTILSSAAGMIAVAAAIRILANSVKALSGIKSSEKLNDSVDAVMTIGFALTAMGAVLAQMNKTTGGFKFQNGAAVTAMAAGIWIIAQTIIQLATLPDLNEAGVAMLDIVAVMGTMAILASQAAKMKFGAGAAMMAMSLSVGNLIATMTAFAAVLAVADFGNLVIGFATVEALLWTLAGITKLINGADTAAAATAMYTMSGSLLVLAAAMAVFDKLGAAGVVGGLLSCAGALGVMFGAIALFGLLKNNAMQAAWTMNTMAKGLLIIAAAGYIFNNVDWEALKVGGVALGGFIAVMLGTSALLGFFPQIEVGLNLLGKAFWNFAKAIGVLAIASAAMGILALFAGPVCQAIVNAASDIEAALIAVITVICNTIIACAEPIGDALLEVAKVVLQKSLDLVSWIIFGTGGEGGGIWGAIKDGLGQIGEKISGFFTGKNFVGKDEGFEDGRQVGKNIAAGTAEGIKEGAQEVTKAVRQMSDDGIETAEEVNEIASPSKVYARLGQYIPQGLAQGIQNGSSGVMTGMQTLSEKLRSVFTTYWGIHSPSDLAMSDAENIMEGWLLGIGDKNKREELRQEAYNNGLAIRDGVTQSMDVAIGALKAKMNELYDAYHAYNLDPTNRIKQDRFLGEQRGINEAKNEDVLIPGKKGLTTQYEQSKDKKKYTIEEVQSYAYERMSALSGDLFESLKSLPLTEYFNKMLSGDYNSLIDMWTDIQNDAEDAITANTGKTSASKSGGKTKTVAETIAEEYEAKLKANKYLKDAADKEWSLWEAGEGKDASDAEYLAKKGEALSREIENQTERVAIAKEEYDKLLEKAPEDDKTKEAYSSWLDEEKSLVTLQRERYESLYKEVLSRQSDRADTEDAEYDLWTAEKEKTADLYEKYGRNTENLTKKIEIQNEIVVTAETKYRELADALGEGSQEAQEAYREWLKQRTEQLNLENSLRKAQLQLYSDEIDRLELEEKTLTNRQNLLAKIYDDGSLADRQDDYAAAVKEYGEDSKEARKIAVQGTMSSIMSLGSAMSGMSYGLKKLTKAQSLYNRYVEEGTQNRDEAIEAYQEVQSLQSDIVGFAEDLATAFDMDETGKKMMMQLGNSLAKNWPKVQTGLKTVFDKLEKAAPALSEKLGNVIGLFGREGASETVTDGLAAVTSAMGGDLGTALTSMLNFALDMAGTDFGKTLSEFLGNEFVKYFPQVAGILSSMLGGGIDLAALGSALSAAVEGAGGLAALLPELLPLAGVIAAAGAALWAVFNWDTVSKWLGGAWKAICDFMNNLDTKLPELLKGLADTLWSILFWPIALPLKLLGGDLKKTADSAAETGTETLSTMLADLSEAEIAPTITPVVDLSDAEESAAWMQSAFALDDGSYSVAGTRTASLAGAVETRAQDERKRQADEAEKPDPADQNRDVVEAVNAMGERIDGVAKAVGNMKMVVNGKKFVGAIRNDMNTALAEVQRG